MRNGHLIFSAVQLLIVAAVLGAGGLLLGLHYAPHIRHELADWILAPNQHFLLSGWLVMGIGLFLTLCFGMMQKTQVLRLEMGGGEFFVEESLVKKAIEQFWRHEFPKAAIPQEIFCSRQKIEVVAEQMECDLDQVELRLGAFLAQKFGYKKEFYVTLTAK